MDKNVNFSSEYEEVKLTLLFVVFYFIFRPA